MSEGGTEVQGAETPLSEKKNIFKKIGSLFGRSPKAESTVSPTTIAAPEIPTNVVPETGLNSAAKLTVVQESSPVVDATSGDATGSIANPVTPPSSDDRELTAQMAAQVNSFPGTIKPPDVASDPGTAPLDPEKTVA